MLRCDDATVRGCGSASRSTDARSRGTGDENVGRKKKRQEKRKETDIKGCEENVRCGDFFDSRLVIKRLLNVFISG